jgi:hypothetical protein
MGAAKTGRTYNTQTPGAAPPVDESVVSIAGMSSDDTTIEIAGKQFPLNEVVQAAFETSGLSLLEWNAIEPEKRDAMLQAQVQELTELTAAAERNQPLTAAPRAKPIRAESEERTRPVRRGYGELPAPHEVDPDEITAPVETTHGWIVPSKPMQGPRRD